MSQRLRPDPRPDFGARQVTTHLQEQLAQTQLAQDDDIERLDEDPSEEDVNDCGDSGEVLSGEKLESIFDQEWSSPLPLEKQLARGISPPVRYMLDASFNVHALDRRADTGSNLSLLIASAVARHIRNSNTLLSKPGDWRHIPAIGSESELLQLVVAGTSPSGRSYDLLRMRFAKVGSAAKAFAILLPNGDVVSPKALLKHAKSGKRATRSGALRHKTFPKVPEKTDELSGEVWTPTDWTALANSETASRTRSLKPKQS